MSDLAVKFPSTPHLLLLDGVQVRDDKVLTIEERDDFLNHTIIVEEKIDGANLGISFDSNCNLILQNRGSQLNLPEVGQWKKLEQWLQSRVDSLFEALSDRYILFGEWCYAKHSIFYDQLPDWFLAFDIYDKVVNEFLSVRNRNKILFSINVESVPFLNTGVFTISDLTGMLQCSHFSEELAEGIYVRIDEGDYLSARAKLVRASFIQAVDRHWSQFDIIPNRVNPEISLA